MRFPLRLIVSLMVAALALPAAGEFRKASSHGLDVYYRVIGQGPPLLVLGGGPGDVSDRYLELCDLLARDAQCILVDQRGTGKSAPAVKNAATINVALTLDDFEAIRRQLGLERWSVLGFSYGGYLASLYAHFFPASVSSLALLGSMGLNWEGLGTFNDNVTSRLRESDRELLAYWRDPARLKADPQQAITEAIRASMPGYFFDREKSLPVRRAVKASDFDFEMGDWIYRDTVERKLDLAQLPCAYAGPVLILHGRQDPGGEGVALGLAQYYRGAKLVFLEKCGHYAYVEQPEKVREAVAGFLAPR